MKKTLSTLLVLVMLSGAMPGFAHSGRTDSAGGHKDNKNASGLGSYHYHCGGHPPHLHSNGVCPYASRTTATAKPKATATPKPKATATATPGMTATPDGDVCYGRTNASGLNVREQASAKSKKVGELPKKGTAIEILEIVEGNGKELWCRVCVDGKEGFVKGEFVDLIEWEEYLKIKK